MTTMDDMARVMFVAAYGEGHTITYDRLPHDGDPVKDGIFCKPYWHQQARAAADELRRALLGDEAMKVATDAFMDETGYDYEGSAQLGCIGAITAAWDALFSDEEGEDGE